MERTIDELQVLMALNTISNYCNRFEECDGCMFSGYRSCLLNDGHPGCWGNWIDDLDAVNPKDS